MAFDILLFVFFIIFPFFRVFEGSLLSNIHNVIAVTSLGTAVLGILFNKLDKYLDTLIKYLLPLLLSSIAAHFFLQTYDSAQIKITHLEVGGPLIFFLWIIKRINIGNFKIHPSRKYALYPALAVIATGIISFIFSPFQLETFEPGIVRRISYVGIFIVTIFEFNRKEDFKRIMYWVLATCLLVVIYGFIQDFGADWHVWAGAFGDRIFSTFGNPNFYAAWLVLVLPLVMAKLLKTRKWYYLIFFFAILYNLYITGTKGSWVGLGVGISVFIVLATLYLIKGDPDKMKKIAGALIGIIVIVTSVGVTWFTVKRIDSLRFRLFTWGACMKMVSEPVYSSPAKAVTIGHGIETFNLVYPSYRRPEIFHIEGKHNTQTDHAHNEFLEVMYDEGIVGITVLLWFLISIFYMAYKRLNRIGVGRATSENDAYLVGLIAGVLGMYAHASVSVHIRFVSSGYILWTFMGLLVVHTAPIKSKSDKPPNGNIITSPKIIPVIAILILIGVNSKQVANRFEANILHNRAIAASKQRQWDRAVNLYKNVQELHPSFIMGYYFEGNVYNDKLASAINRKDQNAVRKNYDKALKMYEKVRSMYPNYVQVHFQEGMLHLRVGNIDKAVTSFRKYMNIVDPVYPHTYQRLSMIDARNKNFKRASWYLKEAIHRKPEIINNYMDLAQILIMMQKYYRAESVYKKALEEKEDNVKVLTALAELYTNLNEDGAARNIYQRILKIEPDNNKIKQKLDNLE
ncbi:MAG: tetratricopeptide repeat protein [Elusimicrobiota bacterium]